MVYYFDEQVEALIRKVLQMENEDIPHQQFADLVYLLLGGELKYNLFAKLYPDHACYDVFIRLENIGTYSEYQKHPSEFNGAWHGAEGTIDGITNEYGAEVIIYHGVNRLKNCITYVQCKRQDLGDELLKETVMKRVLNKQRKTCGSGALYLSYYVYFSNLSLNKLESFAEHIYFSIYYY